MTLLAPAQGGEREKSGPWGSSSRKASRPHTGGCSLHVDEKLPLRLQKQARGRPRAYITKKQNNFHKHGAPPRTRYWSVASQVGAVVYSSTRKLIMCLHKNSIVEKMLLSRVAVYINIMFPVVPPSCLFTQKRVLFFKGSSYVCEAPHPTEKPVLIIKMHACKPDQRTREGLPYRHEKRMRW